MKKVAGALLGLVALAVVGIVGVAAFSGSNAASDGSNPLSSVVEDVKLGATNAAIDASGIKAKVQDAVAEHKGAISAATGLDGAQVDEALARLDIESWQAASLPASAKAAGTVDGSSVGVDGTLTTYDDPGYVTVSAYGQSITLSVPESAQQYLGLLGYLQ